MEKKNAQDLFRQHMRDSDIGTRSEFSRLRRSLPEADLSDVLHCFTTPEPIVVGYFIDMPESAGIGSAKGRIKLYEGFSEEQLYGIIGGALRECLGPDAGDTFTQDPLLHLAQDMIRAHRAPDGTRACYQGQHESGFKYHLFMGPWEPKS